MDNYKDELLHYGVPGMKWGRRKAIKRAVRGERDASRGSASSAQAFDQKIVNARVSGRGGKSSSRVQRAEGRYKTAIKNTKAQAKIDKQAGVKDYKERAKAGKAKALKTLNRVRDREFKNAMLSVTPRNRKEIADRVIGVLAGSVFGGVGAVAGYKIQTARQIKNT